MLEMHVYCVYLTFTLSDPYIETHICNICVLAKGAYYILHNDPMVYIYDFLLLGATFLAGETIEAQSTSGMTHLIR